VLTSVFVVSSLFGPPSLKNVAITNVAISSTGHWLAAGPRDSKVDICVIDGPANCRTVNNNGGELNDLQFSPDEHFLAIANDDIRLIGLAGDAASFFLREDHRKYGTVRFNKGGRELLTINSHSEIELFDISSRKPSTRICCSTFYGEVALFEDGTRVANAGHWPRVWTRSGQLIKSLTEYRQNETLRPISVDEKGRRIFMGSQDGRIYAWSLIDFGLLNKSRAEPGYVDTIALVPNADLLASCSFGKPIHVWSTATLARVAALQASCSSNIVTLPDGVSILFGTDSGTVQIWNLEGSPHLTSEVRISGKRSRTAEIGIQRGRRDE